jgi:hypothetical protein
MKLGKGFWIRKIGASQPRDQEFATCRATHRSGRSSRIRESDLLRDGFSTSVHLRRPKAWSVLSAVGICFTQYECIERVEIHTVGYSQARAIWYLCCGIDSSPSLIVRRACKPTVRSGVAVNLDCFCDLLGILIASWPIDSGASLNNLFLV